MTATIKRSAHVPILGRHHGHGWLDHVPDDGRVQITAQPGPEAQNPWPWWGSGSKRPPQLGEEAVGHAEGQNGTATSSPSQVW